jgi:hypothetical protein
VTSIDTSAHNRHPHTAPHSERHALGAEWRS